MADDNCAGYSATVLAGSASGPEIVGRRHRVNTVDEHVERFHEIAQELLGRFVGDFARFRDQAWSEVDVGFRRRHQRRIAEVQRTTLTLQDQSCSSHCGFDEPRGANTVRYDSFVRDMTTWSVIPW
ncbi:hypothetical protein [Mycobacterium sp.]|uniref:hypothetical protein n=1 Tax=Mycobacterium sp. TaxID=1785 RepID=UPI002CC5949A|nr:hypothetical protein [Mycobacterium sp.]HTQ22970.1 hypothetical protein [Mycobacterium sp.]